MHKLPSPKKYFFHPECNADSSLRGCEALSRGNPERSGSPRLSASQPRDDDRAPQRRSFLKLKLTTLCLLTFCAETPSWAADLIQVFQQAMSSDPTFQQAISQRLSDREYVPINLAALLPSLNLLVSPSLSKATTSGPGSFLLTTGTSRGYSMNLALNQVIFDFGKIAAVAGATDISKQADATLNAALQDLMLRTAKVYFSILEDEDNLRFADVNKRAYAKQLDQVNEQYKVGVKTITDVYTAKASYDEAVAQYIAAQTRLADDRENLRVITGVFYLNIDKLSDKFPLISPHPTDMEAWVKTAQQQNWQIQAALYSAQYYREQIKQAFAGHLPTLDVQGTYNVAFSRNITGPDQFLEIGSSQVHTKTVTLNLNVPLVQGGLVVSETHQAQYNYQVACQKLESQIRTTLNQTRQSYLGVMSGISKIKADRETVQSYISSLEGMRAGYQVGTEILVNVLNQQQKVYQAEKDYAHDRYDYVINLLTLKQATGTLCQRDIMAVNSWLYKAPPGGNDAVARATYDLSHMNELA